MTNRAAWCSAAWTGLTGGVCAAGTIPLDPVVVLRDLEQAYTTEVIAERVEVSITDGFTQRGGAFMVRCAPGQGVRIELGGLIAWATGSRLVVAHEDDLNDYIQFDGVEGLGPLELLSRSLPPIPAPQAALVLNPDGRLSSPTPYTVGVTWREASLVEETGVVRMLGLGDNGVSIELVVDAAAQRIASLTANFNEEDKRLRLRVTPLDPAAHGPLEINLTARSRVTRMSELAPRPGDSTAFRRMPRMRLPEAGSWLRPGSGPGEALVFTDHEAGPAGVYVFFRSWGSEAEAAMAVGREVVSRRGGRLTPVCVTTLGEGAWREVLGRAREAVESPGGATLHCSLAPERTIDRFSPTAAAVLARTDAAGMVTHLEVIEPGDAEPGAAAELLRSRLVRRMTFEAAPE